MRRLDLIPLSAALALCAASCTGVPSRIIQPEKMARVMAEVEIAETVVEMEPSKFRGDSLKKVLLQSVYERNGVTWEEVDSSLMWYGQHIEKYSEVMKRSVEILEKQEEFSREAAGHIAESKVTTNNVDGDSVDIWALPRVWRFSRISPVNIVRFNLSRDRNWEPGDGFELRFKTVDAKNPVDVSLAIEAQNGKRIYINERRRGSGWQNVALRLDSAERALQIYGTVTYQPKGDEVAYIDSVSLIRTHWKPSRRAVPAGQQTVRKR